MHTFKRDRASYFLDQSTHDVPCRVRFAGEASLLSVSKWNGEATLCLAPGGEHEGKIEAKGNEILLTPDATPKARHVFRKLDGERFEYDILLLKEPETNVIEIELDFPEGLEFYRQPSMDALIRSPYRCTPDVEESYAVYWKERNGPYKTGKFCHIYRPLIKDARGRKVWGRLDIVGHMMTITIPDDWLADASYPVVVDPIVGTQTRGALNKLVWWEGEDPDDFYVEISIGFGRFTASTPISGLCTSYIYSDYSSSYTAQAVVYSDTSGYPITRLSRNEQVASFQNSLYTWVPSTFYLPQPIPQGSSFWYGYYTQDIYYSYYDVGGTFRRYGVEEYSAIPDAFEQYPGADVWQVMMSAYFNYSTAQALNRSMMDTVGLTETFGKQFSFKRTCENTTAVTMASASQGFLPRVCTDGLSGNDLMIRTLASFRTVLENLGLADITSRCVTNIRALFESISFADSVEKLRGLIRRCTADFDAHDETYHFFEYKRLMADEVNTDGLISMIQTLFRLCESGFLGIGSLVRRIDFFRNASSGVGFLARLIKRSLLKKEELIIVSRVTREIEFRGNLL